MKPVSQQLVDYLKVNNGFHASGDLQRMVWLNRNKKPITAQTVGRLLRKLAEDKKLVVEYRNNHVFYSANLVNLPKPRIEPHIEIRNGVAVAVV